MVLSSCLVAPTWMSIKPATGKGSGTLPIFIVPAGYIQADENEFFSAFGFKPSSLVVEISTISLNL
jgi:hypothetical protein